MSTVRTTSGAAALALTAVVSTLFTGCSRQPVQPHAGRDAAEEFRRAARQSFEECSDLDCLRRAAASCSAAYWAESFSTIEGTPAARYTFVVKDGPRCSLVGLYDYTADYWGGCRLLKRTCATVESMRNESGNAHDCAEAVIQRVQPCKSPY